MKKCIALILIALLTACENAPSAFVPGPLAFESTIAAPMRIHVAKIEVLNHYQSPLRRPNMEQDFPVAPAKAIEKWVARRLSATGSSGVLQVIIHDGSVKETPLRKTPGVKGLFTDDQDARYDAKLAVTFRLFDGTSIASAATGDVEVTRFITINEKATVFERERIYHQMTDAMMNDFEREANARLHQHFSAVLK